MVSKRRQLRIFWRVIAALAVLVLPVSAAQAQQKSSGTDLVRAGAALVSDGNYAAADKQLSGAISSDKLSTEEMSKALYYRGIANRAVGRPAQSVSDFNGAIWLKGLTSNERALAHMYVGLAYRSAGAKDRAAAALKQAKKLAPDDEQIASALAGEEVAERSSSLSSIRSIFKRKQAAASPEPEAVREPTAQAAKEKKAEPKEAQTAAAEPVVPAFRTTITPAETAVPDEEPKPPKKVARKAPSDVPSNWSTSTSVQPQAGAEPQAGASGQGSPDDAEEKGRIGKFFTSLWNSDDEEAASAEESAVDASPAASNWTKSTRVEEFNESSSSSGARRSYRVQLASSRSEKEARAYWQRLTTQYATVIGGHEPVVEKTDLGALGTFYRLQIGPFADKREPLELCNEFKRSGLDCFLVAR